MSIEMEYRDSFVILEEKLEDWLITESEYIKLLIQLETNLILDYD